MKTIKKIGIGIVLALVVVGLVVSPSAAAIDLDWHVSDFKDKVADWVSQFKDRIQSVIYDKTQSFEDRADAQAEALGMTQRLKYYLDAPKSEEVIDEETGEIIQEGGEPDYSSLEGSWWDKLWGRGIDTSTLPDKEEGERLYAEYLENYISAVQPVPREL